MSQNKEKEPKTKLTVAVIGSRTFQDKERLFKILDNNIDRIAKVVSGGAKGADELSQTWCKARGKPILIFYPDWSQGRGAGMKRNWDIIKSAELVLAFWDGESVGTKNSIEIAQKLGKRIIIVRFGNTTNNEPG